MAAHQYWRIYITANNGDSYTGLAEVEFRNSSGTDLTSSSMTVNQSSQFSSSSGAHTVDDSFSSVWVSGGDAMPQWVSYDFGSAVEPVAVAMACEAYSISTRAPREFSIQYSDDGSSWTDQISITGETSWTANTYKVYYLVTYTYGGTVAEGARTVRLQRRDTGAVLDETVSDETTGAWSISTTYAGECHAICLDDDDSTVLNDKIYRVKPA